MRQIVNILSGVVLGLMPALGAAIFGMLIFNATSNTIGAIAIVLLGASAVWLGIQIFKKIQRTGFIEFITTIHATPELDNLKLTPNSTTKERHPEELVNLIDQGQNLCKGGAIRIYGDWLGRPHETHYQIDKSNYDADQQMLVLDFREGLKLEIYQPEHIHDAPAFFKVMKADKIKVFSSKGNVNQADGKKHELCYWMEGRKILTASNLGNAKPYFDVSLGFPALIIYG